MQINTSQDTDIPFISISITTKEWLDIGTTWLKALHLKIKEKEKVIRNKAIRQAIDDRCMDIIYNQKKMINEILDKPYRKIIIDHLKIDMGNREEILLMDLNDILSNATTVYKQQFRKRIHQFDNISNEWKAIYNPISFINPDLFSSLDHIFTDEEWSLALSTSSSKSTPGSSQIGYNILKKLSHTAHKYLKHLAHWCY